MSQEQFRTVCEDDDGRCSEDAIDPLIVGCSASSSSAHNPVITDSDHSDGFHELKQVDDGDARGAKTCSDLIMPAVTVSSDNGNHVLLNDEIGTNAPIMNATANRNCDTGYNMNVIALSVIESLIENIPEIKSDSSIIAHDFGKDSCNNNGHDCRENKTDIMETKPENTMKDLDKSLYIDDNFQSNDPIESNCCDSGSSVKENLMNALKLSQVSEHNLEQICSNRLQEHEKIQETVHFNSPIATIYEYSALSEALSDDDTDVLSPSGSDYCPASQSAYHNPGVYNNDETDITSLLKLDSNEKNIEGLHLDKECEKDSTFGNQNKNRTVNDVASEQSLGNDSKEITDHASSSDSQVQHHSRETIVEHVLCRTTADTVKAACLYESCVSEVSLNREVTKNDEDQMYQNIPSSSRNEDVALDITQNIQNKVVFDEAQDYSASEAAQAALPTIDSKSEYGISDEISDNTDNPEEVARTKQSNAAINTDFSHVSFDRYTGNEIFQKETLTSDDTDREEHSIYHQIINQCHVESMSNFQTDSMEQSACAEIDVGEHNSCNLNMRPSLVDDRELNDSAQVIDGEMGKDDGNTASGFIPLTIKEEVHEVVDCDKNCHVAYKMNDNVINCELTKCTSDETVSASITGKREIAIMPPEFVGIKRPKLQHNTGELKQTKRKLTNEETQNNEKVRKMDNDIDFGENVSVHQVPKMLKLLSSEKLSSMDEDVVWKCKNKHMDIVQSKIRTEYSNRQGHYIKYDEKELLDDSKSNDLTNENEECFSPQHASNDNLKEQSETTVTDDAEVPNVTDLKMELKIQDINETNKNEFEGDTTTGLDDSEACQFAEQNIGNLKHADDQILSSCKFITATEYLSQSSQDSGSTGFVFDESESMTDICVSQSLNIQTANDASLMQSSQLEKQCHSEIDEPIVYTEEKESRTDILYEIDETDLNEEKMVVLSDLTFSNICEVTKDAGKTVIHDEDEQVDTALLDLYVDEAVDQIVPSYENNEPKLYACDADCDDQDISICNPVGGTGTSQRGQQCFKWKYTPSCDSDISTPELPDEDQVVRVTPLKTCGKPLRLGLSKRQPMKNSLHKMFRH